MSPTEEDRWVAFPNGKVVHAQHGMQRMRGTVDDAIRWEGNTPIFMADQVRFGPPDDGGAPDYFATQQPVVAAVVVSDRGVLVGRRNDGKPPWTFIAGEQDAVKDENPADTAVREVKEETGLRIQAGDVIGERVHPKTGRRMIYIAAAPTHGTDVFVGDEDELAEVRWVSLAEADELLPGMYPSVREHLARKLGEA
jgi:8-oxo-dGTP diphosphatase